MRTLSACVGLWLVFSVLCPAAAAQRDELPPAALGAGDLADQITASLRGAKELTGRRVAVLPFVDLNDLQVVSDLGRAVGEELASALHFRNFHLAEIRGDDRLVMARRVGELYLARTGPDRLAPAQAAPVQNVAEKYNLGGFVVGTYAVLPGGWLAGALQGRQLTGDRVALNARLIEPLSGAVLAVGSVQIQLDDTVAALLKRRTSAQPPPIQKIKQREF